jgi:hypothetical protein
MLSAKSPSEIYKHGGSCLTEVANQKFIAYTIQLIDAFSSNPRSCLTACGLCFRCSWSLIPRLPPSVPWICFAYDHTMILMSHACCLDSASCPLLPANFLASCVAKFDQTIQVALTNLCRSLTLLAECFATAAILYKSFAVRFDLLPWCQASI